MVGDIVPIGIHLLHSIETHTCTYNIIIYLLTLITTFYRGRLT